MYTAFVLVRNLDHASGANPAQLDFRDFKIWNIPQFQGINGERMARARKIFCEATIEDWIYERSYTSPPSAPGPAPSGFGGIPEDVEDTLLLFRLFKSGDLSFVQVKIRDPNGKISRQCPYRVVSDISTTMHYRLDQEECAKWDIFASELKNAQSWTAAWFQIARRFFLYGGAKEFNCYKEPQAGIEINEVDRIVDYMIALEATLVPEKDFVGRRLRERAVRLLCKDEEAKRLLRDFYDIRSTIAHGSFLSDKQRQLITNKRKEFECTVRKVLVEALQKVPKDEKDRKRMLEGLWVPSDADRAKKLFEDFGTIQDGEERRRLSERLAMKLT